MYVKKEDSLHFLRFRMSIYLDLMNFLKQNFILKMNKLYIYLGSDPFFLQTSYTMKPELRPCFIVI